MKLIREDVQAGTKEEVAGYGDITLQAGNVFIEIEALREAKKIRGKMNVSEVYFPATGLVRHSAVVSTEAGLPVAHFYGEWADDEEEEE